jgi:hypothetical protein
MTPFASWESCIVMQHLEPRLSGEASRMIINNPKPKWYRRTEFLLGILISEKSDR